MNKTFAARFGRTVAEAQAPNVERDALIGRTLDGRYRVLSVLARGGMSRVYRAEQHPLGRTVALKVLTLAGNPEQEEEFRQRFLLEASVCARLTHPNTVRVFDHGQVGNELLYIAMEFLDGRTLHQVIKTEWPLSAPRIVSLARQICGSLREAHAQGLIHRDLKPANVVLLQHDDEDFVKVLDFGLVKQLRTNDELTGTDAVVGSPSYMSPEQIRAERLDVRSDIYSFGVILYAAIAGRPPFVAETSVGVLLAHLNQPPPALDPDCPALTACPTLGWLVNRCLEKRAEDRFADVDEVLRALRLCESELRGEPVVPPLLREGRIDRDAAPPPKPPPIRSVASVPEPSASTMISSVRSQRGPILAATGAMMMMILLGAAILLAGLGAWWWHRRQPAPEAPILAVAPASRAAPPVEISTSPDGATLSHDGVRLGAAPLSLPIPTGEVWEIQASSAGYVSQMVRLPWDAVRRQITLEPLPKVESPARPARPRGGAPAPSRPATPPEAATPSGGKPSGDLRDPWSPR